MIDLNGIMWGVSSGRGVSQRQHPTPVVLVGRNNRMIIIRGGCHAHNAEVARSFVVFSRHVGAVSDTIQGERSQ